MSYRYTLEDLSQIFDHTNLKADATLKDIEMLCQEAIRNNFKSIMVNQAYISYCRNLLLNNKILVGATVSFPLGQTTLKSKLQESKESIDLGVDEIDYVINIAAVKDGRYDYIKQEMKEITNLCHTHQVIVKVIFENCYLTSEEIEQVARIAKEVKPDFIKTSTGFGMSGAKIEDIKLMKTIVGNEVKVKAAGGISDADTVIQMLKAGAERIGASLGVEIMEEFKEKFEEENIEVIEI